MPPVEGDGEEGEYAGGHRHQGGEVVHDAVGQPEVPSPATRSPIGAESAIGDIHRANSGWFSDYGNQLFSK